MAAPSQFAYPQPTSGDDDDVVWALQAGAVEWQRGANADALVWLRRAIEAANAAGNAFRASEIQAALDELAELMWGGSGAESVQALDSSDLTLADLAPGDFRDHKLDSSEVEAEDLTDEALVAEEAWVEDDESRDSLIERDSSTMITKVPDFAPEESDSFLEPESPSAFDSEPPAPPDDAPGSGVQHVGEAHAEPTDLEASDADPEDRLSSLLPDLERYSQTNVKFPSEPDTDIKTIMASVRPSAPVDLGNEPIDQAIASSLESEPSQRFSLRPSGAHRAYEPAEPALPQKPVVDGVPLDECLGFEDLPPEIQLTLAAAARLEKLRHDEELSAFGAALVTHGAAAIVTDISDEPALLATKGDVVFTEGSLQSGTKLRVVSTSEETVVAVWSHDELHQALRDCPWVHETLHAIADRFQALAGATLGILGERLDSTLRRTVIDRMQVQAFGPGQVVIAKGTALPGLFIVAAGRVELLGEHEQTESEALTGDFLFPDRVLSAQPASHTARAGAKGALLLSASRAVTHELVISMPPLLEALVS